MTSASPLLGRSGVAVLALLVLSGAGCGQKESGSTRSEISTNTATAADEAPTHEAAAENSVPEESTTENFVESIDNARKQLDAGQYDTAAANLLRLEMGGRQMGTEQAATYRETLGQAISAAAAAAERGDPKGQAVIQMLRATRRR